MSEFSPSPLQAAGIKKLAEWYKTGKSRKQIFRVFGYAGTGKSTLVNTAIEEIGLKPFVPTAKEDYGEDLRKGGGVLFGTFTGKAAKVLRDKGTPARTIHSMLYRLSEATPEQAAEMKKHLADLNAKIPRLAWGGERDIATAQAASIQYRLDHIHKPIFTLNDQSIINDASLIVLDECSMIGEDMARDLLSFGKPILVLGDPGQLPPIKGEGYFTNAEPDVLLTEVHRQAEDSAVLRLATMARQGEYIPYGMHDEFVCKIRRQDVSAASMLKACQVICGRNATRMMLNNSMRAAAGFEGTLPNGPEEKLICLKNDNALGLFNGGFLKFDNIKPGDDIRMSATVTTEEGVNVGAMKGNVPQKHTVYAGHFYDHIDMDKDREKRDWKHKKKMIEATFGYAITAHKAQGSQYENVMVYDEGFGRTDDDRRRWLYTAITRAEKGLVILS